ncbi:MAG TPA: hypothetical protein VI229_02585, partial [Burkholderiales bacterium]
MLMVLAMGSTWYLVSRLNDNTGIAAAARKARDAQVLNRAKQALIGYVAAQAANIAEDNPGSLPCPEAAGYFDNPGQEGQTASSCTLPKVGRFPWRTIGTEKLLDSAGEPLWYVVSPGWAVTSAGVKTTGINSNALGQLTVDGAANAAVALIIAPGRAFNVPACGANAAISQTRPTVGSPDWRNYLECENATWPTPDATFVTTGTSDTFNDQVVRVTVADLMPGIEAAIAKRIERSVLPSLQTAFSPAIWGIAGTSVPVLPFAAPFASPGPGAGTASYQGSTATYNAGTGIYSGLLPFNQTQGCAESATDRRCTTVTSGTSATTGLPAFLAFSKPAGYVDAMIGGSGSVRTSSTAATCVWQSSVYVCTGEYNAPSISVSVSVNVANVAMGLRTWDASKVTCSAVDDVGNGNPETAVACAATIALQADGSAIITVATGLTPDIAASGWGTYANYKIKFDRAAFGDHELLSTTDPGTCPSYGCVGWFARNEWYRLVYYAVSRGNTAAQL